MKKILSFILIAVLCLGIFTGCELINKIPGLDDVINKIPGFDNDKPDDGGNTNVEYNLPRAAEYINTLYKGNPNEDGLVITQSDFTVVAQCRVAAVPYTVNWSVDNELVKLTKIKDDKGNDVWNVDVTSDSEVAYDYKLTATIIAGDGTSTEVVFNFHVNAYVLSSFEEYMAAKQDVVVTVEGVVVAINAKSLGNSRNHLFLADQNVVGGYYIYQMESDPIKDGIKVGMTVSVTGPVSPYSGMQEIKGGVATIIDETIKDPFVPVDITNDFAAGNSLKNYVGLPVTVKGVTIGGQDLETSSSQYLYFELNGVKSYIRTYITDFPTGLEIVVNEDTTVTSADKTAIDEAHAAKFGWTANATGILVLYNSAPYLIPMDTNCFEYLEFVEKTDDEKITAELEGISIPEAITADTVLELPLAGKNYTDVKFSWTVDNSAFVIGEDGKCEIKLSGNAVTLKFTLTATVGETTETQEYTVQVAANFVMSETRPYVPYINQVKAGKVLYLDGGVSGRYLTTTTDSSKAVEVFAEKADGGYKFYILVDNAKMYINIYTNSDNKTSVNYAATTESVFSYNPATNALCSVFNGDDVYLGTYNTYETISVSFCSYINSENTGVEQFPFELLAVKPDGEYTGSLVQAKIENKVLYLDGGVSGRYLTTTEDASKAITLYAEKVDGGFKFYILVDGAKQYVNLYNNAESKLSVNYDANGTSVFAYNALVNAWVTEFDGTEYYLGTYNTYNTISASKLSYITAENTGKEQFPLEYFPVVKAECEHVWVDATCTEAKKCSVCGATDGDPIAHTINAETHLCTVCGADDPTYYWPMSITEAIASKDGKLVIVKGTVKTIDEVWSDKYNNITVTIEDEAGNTLYIYRLKTNVKVGDVVTITGKVGSYNGSKQIASGATAVIESSAEGGETDDGETEVPGVSENKYELTASAISTCVDENGYSSDTVSVVATKGTHPSSAPIYHATNDEIRVYGYNDQDTGENKTNTFTITIDSSKVIDKIVIAVSGSSRTGGDFVCNDGDTDWTKTVDGTTVTLDQADAGSDYSVVLSGFTAQLRVKTITIYYK